METTYTTISIKPETWRRLSQIKSYPSQTFDTIINNLIDRKNNKLKEEIQNDNN